MKKLFIFLYIFISIHNTCYAKRISNEPKEMLIQAYQLLNNKDHITARKLIDDSINIYKDRNDYEGLIYALKVSSDYYSYMKDEFDKNYHSSAKYIENKRTLELDKISKKISHVIGKALCTKDKQCSSIPLGRRACGGPSSYKIFSTLNTEIVNLKKLSEKHMELSRSSNLSICIYLEPPAVICNKICTRK